MNTYNVNQVPLLFAADQGTTYLTVGNKEVQVPKPYPVSIKSKLCIRAEGEQKPALLFRRKGDVSSLEKENLDERVDVYFQ